MHGHLPDTLIRCTGSAFLVLLVSACGSADTVTRNQAAAESPPVEVTIVEWQPQAPAPRMAWERPAAASAAQPQRSRSQTNPWAAQGEREHAGNWWGGAPYGAPAARDQQCSEPAIAAAPRPPVDDARPWGSATAEAPAPRPVQPASVWHGGAAAPQGNVQGGWSRAHEWSRDGAAAQASSARPVYSW